MAQRNYGLITSLDELAQHCAGLLASDATIAIDIETGYYGPDREKGAVHPETAFIAGFSFTSNPMWAHYVPLNHDTGENLDNVEVARLLWPVLGTGRAIAHNLPFELRHLSRWFMQYLADDPVYGHQVRASGGYFPGRSDTQVEAYLRAEFNHGTQTVVGLKELTKRTFEHTMTQITDLFPDLTAAQLKALRFNTLDPTDPKVRDYACEDSAWALALHERNHPHVRDMGLYRIESYIVQHLLPAMEDFGIAYDWAKMRRAATELCQFRAKFNAEIMAELSELAGQPIAINLGSPPQIGKVLYDILGMRTSVYTPGTKDKPRHERKMSTGAIALAKLAEQHAVVKRILQWKELNRLLGTYLGDPEAKKSGGYETKYLYADDGRAHPSHLSAYVVTGRFAVADPAYQQSPKKYHFDLAEARAVHADHAAAHGSRCDCAEFPPPPGTCFMFNFRDCIIAPRGYYILGFDLSQAELRAIAGEANETALLRAFAAGEDVHTLTAALMLGKPIEEVTKDDRDIGKTMNFALLYGMGVKSLADRLALDIEQAQVLYDKYFAAYPNIAAWSRRQVELGRRQGYVTSRFGRKLPIWEFLDDRPWMQQKGERACVNYPIQGGATGDYVKTAMVRAHMALRNAGLLDRVHLVMNIHDALEFYVDENLTPQQVIDVLQPAVIFPVAGWPVMHADWHIARSWGSPVDITIEPDGTLSTKAGRLDDLRPLIEVDEDTGDEIEVMPEVDREQLVAVATPSAPVPSTFEAPPATTTIAIEQMPDAAQWDEFLDYVDQWPGTYRLILRTPEGDLEISAASNVSAEHSVALSRFFDSVHVTFEESYTDATALGDGLTFT